MATLLANPLSTNGQVSQYAASSSGMEAINDRSLTDWSLVNVSSGTVADTGTFSAVQTINAQFATKPATGNLMIIVITLQSNVRVTPPSGWTEMVDAGSTSRAIAVYAKRQDGTVEAATNIAFTTGSNVTGNWTAMNFDGPVGTESITDAGSSLGVEHVTSSVTSDSQTPAARAKGAFPCLRLSVIAFSSGRDSLSVSGGDQMSGIVAGGGTAARYGIAWDRELNTTQTYTASQTPTDTSWSWTTSGTASDVVIEFPGIGLEDAADGTAITVGASSTGSNTIYQAGFLFDTSAIGSDTISSAKFEIKASTNSLTSTKKIELIAGRLDNGSTSLAFDRTKWSQVFDSQGQLSTTILGSMTGANITANATASSASFLNLNGSNGLNADTDLKNRIKKDGVTSLKLVAEENRTTFTDSTENVIFHGSGVAGTDHDPLLTVVYAPPATTANATAASGTGAANSPSKQTVPTIGVATVTGAANSPAALIVGTAGYGTTTGASYDATVSTASSGTTANAAVAATTGASYDGTVQAAPVANYGTVTGTSLSPSGKVQPNTTVGTGTGTSVSPSGQGVPTANSGTVTGTSLSPSGKVQPNTTVGTVTGTANGVSGQAAPIANYGTTTGAAYNGTVSTSGSGLTANANVATLLGAGYDAAGQLSTAATSSSATVASLTVTGTVNVGPANAAGTGTVNSATRLLSGSASVAAVTGQASVGGRTIGALASAATVQVAGYTTTQQVGVSAQSAAGTVVGFNSQLFGGQADTDPYLLVLDYSTMGALNHDLTATSDHQTRLRLDS